MTLHDLLTRSADRHGSRPAVVERDGRQVSYAELSQLSAGLRDHLAHLDVEAGDRVGLYVRKSIDSVAAVFGVLRRGAAYVPVDPSAPTARNAFVFSNCNVAAIIVERRFVDALEAELRLLDTTPHLIVIDDVGGGNGLWNCLNGSAPQVEDASPNSDELAYILYTSGSTGKPKGVKISHENAMSFVDWGREVFVPTPDDRFSSHAPFHFDLSIFDIFTSIGSGARLVLIDEEIAKNPGELARYIASSGITIWYSAPSILTLLLQFGKLEQVSVPELRCVLFAGEVFPATHLRNLMCRWPGPRYYNLYGPTETNVCTYFEVPAVVPADRKDPYPIGKVCSHLEGIVVDPEGRRVAGGAEGELCIAGPSVTAGYWGLPEQTERAYLVDAEDSVWYRTGDLVYEDSAGDYVFVGRRDRMVKKRGYRVELGEIESCLYQHDDVLEAAVVATQNGEEVRIVAHLSTRGAERISTLKLKQFCAGLLPLYMVPDEFKHHAELPKTSTDKIDYQNLSAICS